MFKRPAPQTFTPHVGLIIDELKAGLSKFFAHHPTTKTQESHPRTPVVDEYATWDSEFTHLLAGDTVQMSVGVMAFNVLTTRADADRNTATIQDVSLRLWDIADLADKSGYDLWAKLVIIAMEALTPYALSPDGRTVFFTTEKHIIKIENLSYVAVGPRSVERELEPEVKQVSTTKVISGLKPTNGVIVVRPPIADELAGVYAQFIHQGSGAMGVVMDVGYGVPPSDRGGVVVGDMVIYDIPKNAIWVHTKDHGKKVLLTMDDIRAVFTSQAEM